MADTLNKDVRNDLNALQRRAIIVGGVGALILVVGLFLDREHFFQAYLIGWVLWVGVAVGGLAVSLLHSLTGGTWGMATRRIFEASSRTIPVLGLLFIPLAFGLPSIYEWARPEEVAGDALLQLKQIWLNVPFFIGRTALYFVLWSAVAFLLSRRSWQLDRTADPEDARKLQQFSGLAMLVVVLGITFAAFDWVMSLEPHWFSSIFGAIMGAGMILATFTFSIIVTGWLSRRAPLAEVVTPNIFNDMGSLTLAFIMIWGYLTLSQLLIIWSANIPEEVTWYLHRGHGGWEIVNIALAVLHFAVPFVLLLSRTVRSSRRNITRLAAFVFFMHFVQLFWLIKPSFATERFELHWLDVVAPIAMGGIYIALFVWQLRGHPLLPLPAIPRLRQIAAEQHAH